MIQSRVNQKMIAKRLSLSPATVSKSLRNHPDITPATRARVLEYAAQLGYQVELTPRGTRFGTIAPQTRFVGVLISDTLGPDARDYSGQGYLTGLSEAAARHGVSLIVHRFSGENDLILNPEHQPAAMRAGMLEGAVLVHRYDPAVVRQLAAQFPCITLTFYAPDARCDHIDSNHAGAMYKLVGQLKALGHENIGYIARPGRPTNMLARFGSFAQAIARHELALDTGNLINVLNPVNDFAQQAELAERRMKSAGVTAWVCSVDSVGYNLWKRLLDRGYRVPQDVCITGFDTDEQMFGLPQLTSVRVPFVSMGNQALTRLLERIDHPSAPAVQIHFDCEIVQGESTGPVRS